MRAVFAETFGSGSFGIGFVPVVRVADLRGEDAALSAEVVEEAFDLLVSFPGAEPLASRTPAVGRLCTLPLGSLPLWAADRFDFPDFSDVDFTVVDFTVLDFTVLDSATPFLLRRC